MMQPGNLMGAFGNIANLVQKFNQFRQNPIGAIMQMGFNVPPHLQNNPQGTVNYLRNSGQMSDEQFNQFAQMAQMFQNNISK